MVGTYINERKVREVRVRIEIDSIVKSDPYCLEYRRSSGGLVSPHDLVRSTWSAVVGGPCSVYAKRAAANSMAPREDAAEVASWFEINPSTRLIGVKLPLRCKHGAGVHCYTNFFGWVIFDGGTIWLQKLPENARDRRKVTIFTEDEDWADYFTEKHLAGGQADE